MKIYLTFATILLFNVLCVQAQSNVLFADDFESPQTWTIFEEIVSGNACYGDNLGEVIRSPDVAHGGTNALRVWANKNQSTKSNHVIAAHHISNTEGVTGRLRYSMWAYCASTIGLTQSGPEFSVQSTRPVNGQNLTYIAGIQYIGNQWITNSKWNIWHNGTWKAISTSELGVTLAINTWYYLELEFDMTTHKYISFKIQGGSVNVTLDLTQSFANAANGFEIGGEVRNWTPSYFVTTESENLWTTCSQVYENKVYYDDVLLQSISIPLPVELLHFDGIATPEGNLLTWSFEDKKDVAHLEIDLSKNGKDFSPLSKLLPSDVSFFDANRKGLVYYRLKIYRLDGSLFYSKTINLASQQKQNSLYLYPNPATHTLRIDGIEGEHVTLVNALGQVILSEFVANMPHDLDISLLPKGIYFIKTPDTLQRFVKL